MLQNRIVRIVTGSEYLARTNPLYYRTGILKISDIHKIFLAIYVYKNKNNLSHPTYSYNTRHRNDPLISFHRLTLSRHSVSYSAPSLWFSIPNEIKNSHSLAFFKRKYKSYLLSHYNSLT